jgi:hypothetical protein
VTFLSSQVAREAMEKLDGEWLDDRQLVCMPCLPKGVKGSKLPRPTKKAKRRDRRRREFTASSPQGHDGSHDDGGQGSYAGLGSPFVYTGMALRGDNPAADQLAGSPWGIEPIYVKTMANNPSVQPSHARGAPSKDSGYGSMPSPPFFLGTAGAGFQTPGLINQVLGTETYLGTRDLEVSRDDLKTTVFLPALDCRITELPAEPTPIYRVPKDSFSTHGRTLQVSNLPPIPGHRALESEMKKLFHGYNM